MHILKSVMFCYFLILNTDQNHIFYFKYAYAQLIHSLLNNTLIRGLQMHKKKKKNNSMNFLLRDFFRKKLSRLKTLQASSFEHNNEFKLSSSP